VIGYARGSKDEQELTLEAQEKRMREACNSRGMELVQVIHDPGEWSGSLDRPGLKRTLAAIAAGRADAIMVAKLDRLSRSIIDFGLLLEWFGEQRKTLIALDLGIDTSTATGELVAGVMMTVAQWERRTIGERTKTALATLRAQGKPISQPAIIDQPDLLARIRDMRERQGMTLRAICEVFEREGVPTLRGGQRWRPSSLEVALGYQRPPRKRKHVDLPKPRRSRAHPSLA
jgi:DNA invertase Pin-like site-specific DNA recombinase